MLEYLENRWNRSKQLTVSTFSGIWRTPSVFEPSFSYQNIQKDIKGCPLILRPPLLYNKGLSICELGMKEWVKLVLSTCYLGCRYWKDGNGGCRKKGLFIYSSLYNAVLVLKHNKFQTHRGFFCIKTSEWWTIKTTKKALLWKYTRKSNKCHI